MKRIIGPFVFAGSPVRNVWCISSLPARPKPTRKPTVSECKYLGEVIGTSKAGNMVYDVGKNRAKDDALEQAAKLGGTHIVWFQAIDSYPIRAICDVYLCP
jgi:hypothetical protein